MSLHLTGADSGRQENKDGLLGLTEGLLPESPSLGIDASNAVKMWRIIEHYPNTIGDCDK
jgi:hypothetical protein